MGDIYSQYRNPHNDKEERHPEMRMLSMIIHLLSGLAAMLQCFTPTIVFGLILLFIVYMMLKAQRMTSQGTIYQTHVEYARSTINIGMFFFFPLSIIVALYIVWTNTGLAEALGKAGQEEDFDRTIIAVQSYVTANKEKIQSITMWSMIPTLVWWLRRCIVGYEKAKASEPIDWPGSLI